MSPRLAELTAHAQTLTSTGDLTGARAVLADALAPVRTDPQHADPDLAEAAALHARILITLGDAHGARTWAQFAQAAQLRLHGPQDERTLAATATHAAVLQRVGSHTRAAELYADILGRLTAMDGPDSARVLAAEADLATAEHAGGHCATGRRRLTDAWRRHRRAYGDAALPGIKMLARLGAMERECGDDAAAREHLALAQELCARYLPADHTLSVQVGALARAPASGMHVCRRVGTSGASPAPGVRTVPRTDPPGVVPVPPGPRPEEAATEPDEFDEDRFSDERGWPPETVTGGSSFSDEEADDDRRLPVPLDQPERTRSRRPLVIAAALLAGLVVVGAAVLPRLGDDGDPTGTAGPTPAATTAAPAAQASAAPPTAAPPTAAPPTDVSLRDNRDSVTLEWRYPAGSEGPILISGGRVGQDQRAFQQLPAGTANYVVYGLNEGADYCFTVAVVYSVESVASSRSVCTKRDDGAD